MRSLTGVLLNTNPQMNAIIGNVGNDDGDGDGNENGKKAIELD